MTSDAAMEQDEFALARANLKGDTKQFAEYIYKRMCDYVGAGHREHCVDILARALASQENGE